MTITDDKTARRHSRVLFTEYVRSLFWRMHAVCLPLCAIVAFFLYSYDDVDRQRWIIALCATPGMYLALRAMPFLVELSEERWTFDNKGIRLRGPRPGYIRFDEIRHVIVRPEEGLEDYHSLTVVLDRARASIILRKKDFPESMFSEIFPHPIQSGNPAA